MGARQTVERYTTLNGGDAVSGPPLESNCDNKEQDAEYISGAWTTALLRFFVGGPFNFSDNRALLPFPMPDTPLMIGTVPGFHKIPPRRDVNQAVNVAGGRGHAWGRISRAPLAAPLIGLGGARANGMMAARAVVHGFCARSGAVLCHDGSA